MIAVVTSAQMPDGRWTAVVNSGAVALAAGDKLYHTQLQAGGVELTDEQFEEWWQANGQFCRAGGGNYEKTFAYRAWQAADRAARGGSA